MFFAQCTDKYNLSTDTSANRPSDVKRVYFCTRIEKRPKIDGKLNDLCWESGIWSGGFIQQIPGQGKTPSQETQLKFCTMIIICTLGSNVLIKALELLSLA